MKQVAKRLAAQGRHGDDQLIHMSKGEVRALHGIASLAGRKLTKNPKTGLTEAFNLFDILPFALNFIFPGMGTLAQIGIGALSGAASSSIEGNDPLTGALTGGALSGLGSALFGGSAAADAATKGLTNQAGNIAGQGATAAGALEGVAGAVSPETVVRSVSNVGLPEAGSGLLSGTGLEGGGLDRWLADPLSKGNLPYTLGGGAALASLMPMQGLDTPEQAKANVAKPAAPRRYTPAPAGYLAGYDPEWQYFTPNPGPYFQGDPNYGGYAGGGIIGYAGGGHTGPVNTNTPDDNVEPMMSEEEIQRFMHQLDQEARRRAKPTTAQQASDMDDYKRRQQMLMDSDAMISRLQADRDREAMPPSRPPLSGYPFSGEDVPSNVVRIPLTEQVILPLERPQFVPGTPLLPQGDVPVPVPTALADDAERFYQDKINLMHAQRKRWKNNPIDRQKYDYYVNMRDLERSKKTGQRINPRFDPTQTRGLEESRYAKGGIACYARGGSVDRASGSMALPDTAWWRGEGVAPEASISSSGKAEVFNRDPGIGRMLDAMTRGELTRRRGGQGQAPVPAATPPVFTLRPPGSYVSGNALIEAPSIEPKLFTPVTGMAGGGHVGLPMPQSRVEQFNNGPLDMSTDESDMLDPADPTSNASLAQKSGGGGPGYPSMLGDSAMMFGHIYGDAPIDDQVYAAIQLVKMRKAEWEQAKAAKNSWHLDPLRGERMQAQLYSNALQALDDLRELQGKYKPYIYGSKYAEGGLASLGGSKQALLQQLMGRQVPGHGMGMDDDVPAAIDGHEPAALSSGEFVVPADAVAMLGDGNSQAGAKQLEGMISRIRMMKTGKAKQAPRINPKRVMPA